MKELSLWIRHGVGSWIVIAAFGIGANLIAAHEVAAQACPFGSSGGAGVTAEDTFARVKSQDSYVLHDFIGTAGCTTQYFGAATGCRALRHGAARAAALFATWPSTGARTMDSTGGCEFMCAGGTCQVLNNGLPVELLEFGVE